MNPVQIVTLSPQEKPQPQCFTTKPCAVRQQPYHALTMTRHEMSRMKRRVKAFSMQATHIKEIYGNFTLPKLFIDVSWYVLVVVAKKWLVSGGHWSGDLPVHQRAGSCQSLKQHAGLSDPLVWSTDRPVAGMLGSI